MSYLYIVEINPWSVTYFVTTFSHSQGCFFISFVIHIYSGSGEEGSPGSSNGKEFACSAEDLSFVPGSGRTPGKGSDNPLQYSCLENSMDRGAWRATVHGVAKSWT